MMEKSLKTDYPEIAAEWDYDKNHPYRPEAIGHGSTKKVFWICPKGHSYQARIDHRTIMHSGCPYCAGKLPIIGVNDLLTVYPDLAAEWDWEKNNTCPEDYLPHSNKTVFWKCPYCGNSYKRTISGRTLNKQGCTLCAKERGTSFQEQSIVYYLSLILIVENRYRIEGEEGDVYLPSLNTGIEYNGRYYHKGREAKDKLKHDKLRKSGMRLIVIEEGAENSFSENHIAVQASEGGRVDDKNLEWAIRELFVLLGLACPAID